MSYQKPFRDFIETIRSKVALRTAPITTEEEPLHVSVSGTTMEFYGATEDERPSADAVEVGAVYMAVDSQTVWQSNGTDWVVM